MSVKQLLMLGLVELIRTLKEFLFLRNQFFGKLSIN